MVEFEEVDEDVALALVVSVVDVRVFLPRLLEDEDEDKDVEEAEEKEEEPDETESEMVIVIAGVEVIVDTTTSVMVIVVGLGMAPPWSSMLEVEVTVGLLLSSGVVLGLSSTEVVGDALPEVDEPLEEDSSSSSSSLPPLPLPFSALSPSAAAGASPFLSFFSCGVVSRTWAPATPAPSLPSTLPVIFPLPSAAPALDASESASTTTIKINASTSNSAEM